MRAVIQRVHSAKVEAEGTLTGEIGRGLLVFLGISQDDIDADLEWLANKIANLRIFDDQEGKMNCSVQDISGGILLISQFTLFGNCKKGTRPSFNRAGHPDKAIPMYEAMRDRLAEILGKPVPTGKFAAMMKIDAINDGPVTIILDTVERGF